MHCLFEIQYLLLKFAIYGIYGSAFLILLQKGICEAMDELQLIDFSVFPNGMFSGLTINEIEQYLKECEKPPSDVPEEIREKLNKSEDSMRPYTTKRQEIEHVNRLKKFLSSKNIECDFETVSEERLNDLL